MSRSPVATLRFGLAWAPLPRDLRAAPRRHPGQGVAIPPVSPGCLDRGHAEVASCPWTSMNGRCTVRGSFSLPARGAAVAPQPLDRSLTLRPKGGSAQEWVTVGWIVVRRKRIMPKASSEAAGPWSQRVANCLRREQGTRAPSPSVSSTEALISSPSGRTTTSSASRRRCILLRRRHSAALVPCPRRLAVRRRGAAGRPRRPAHSKPAASRRLRDHDGRPMARDGHAVPPSGKSLVSAWCRDASTSSRAPDTMYGSSVRRVTSSAPRRAREAAKEFVSLDLVRLREVFEQMVVQRFGRWSCSRRRVGRFGSSGCHWEHSPADSRQLRLRGSTPRCPRRPTEGLMRGPPGHRDRPRYRTLCRLAGSPWPDAKTLAWVFAL